MTQMKIVVQVTFKKNENASQQTERNVKDVEQVGSSTRRRWYGFPAFKSWVWLVVVIIKSLFF